MINILLGLDLPKSQTINSSSAVGKQIVCLVDVIIVINNDHFDVGNKNSLSNFIEVTTKKATARTAYVMIISANTEGSFIVPSREVQTQHNTLAIQNIVTISRQV